MADEASWYRELSQICRSACECPYAYAYAYALVKTRLKVSTHDLHWENKTYKLKRPIDYEVRHHLYGEKFSPEKGSPNYPSDPRRAEFSYIFLQNVTNRLHV